MLDHVRALHCLPRCWPDAASAVVYLNDYRVGGSPPVRALALTQALPDGPESVATDLPFVYLNLDKVCLDRRVCVQQRWPSALYRTIMRPIERDRHTCVAVCRHSPAFACSAAQCCRMRLQSGALVGAPSHKWLVRRHSVSSRCFCAGMPSSVRERRLCGAAAIVSVRHSG